MSVLESLEPFFLAKFGAGCHYVPSYYYDDGHKNWFQRAGGKAMETHTFNSYPSHTEAGLGDNLEGHCNTRPSIQVVRKTIK